MSTAGPIARSKNNALINLRLLLGLLAVLWLLGGCDSPAIAEPAPPAAVSQPAAAVAEPTDTPLASATALPAPEDKKWVADFAAYIQDAQEENSIPGLSLAVVNGDGPLLVEGYGLRDVEKNLPVDGDTLFHIGSTHKSMTALLVATLVDAGVVEWDTPVVEIDPDFALAEDDASETVTFRHLLSMTSGIPDDAEEALPDSPSVDDIFAVAGEAELLDAPGEVFSYSNISSSLAGYLAALAAGSDFDTVHESYARLLRERLLDPLGMETATVYVSEARQNPNHSLAYDTSGGDAEALESEDRDDDALAPSGSLKASAREMGLYMQMLVNRGMARDGTRIVSEESLAEMWTPLLEEYGLGWEIVQADGLRLVSHTGAFDGFVSVIGLLPEAGVGFVLLVNAEEGGGDLTEAAAQAFAKFYSQSH
ncbi:MAG: beta-lactamase family protein [Caldilineaceae bacterium]|nr:beta-lactamase family protein [Caldilineaceae bacterium]